MSNVQDSQHTKNLREQLQKVSAEIRPGDGRYNSYAAAQAVQLERRLTDSIRLDKLEAEKQAGFEQRQREAERVKREGLEAELMARYRQMVPGASALEARQALPRLLEEHRQRQEAEADAEHRATVTKYRSAF